MRHHMNRCEATETRKRFRDLRGHGTCGIEQHGFNAGAKRREDRRDVVDGWIDEEKLRASRCRGLGLLLRGMEAALSRHGGPHRDGPTAPAGVVGVSIMKPAETKRPASS